MEIRDCVRELIFRYNKLSRFAAIQRSVNGIFSSNSTQINQWFDDGVITNIEMVTLHSYNDRTKVLLSRKGK
jgi:hypothetical protein